MHHSSNLRRHCKTVLVIAGALSAPHNSLALSPDSSIAFVAASEHDRRATLSADNADWAPYRGEQYGFEFQFPRTMGSSECGTNKDMVLIGQRCGISALAPFSLGIEASHPKEYLVSNYARILRSCTNFATRTISVSGGEATRLSCDEKPSAFPNSYRTYVVFSKRGTNYVAGSDDPVLLQRILSSFRFTR